MPSVYDFDVLDYRGAPVPLSAYQGQVLLIVNTATSCIFTSQFAGLQSLQERFHEQGFTVLGFPSNQFANQEPRSNEDIQTFCQTKYDVTFPVFEKILVNGPEAHPLFQYLTEARRGLLGSGRIKWNFTKFLIDQNGHVVKRYAPTVTPDRIAFDIKRWIEKTA